MIPHEIGAHHHTLKPSAGNQLAEFIGGLLVIATGLTISSFVIKDAFRYHWQTYWTPSHRFSSGTELSM